MDFQSPGLPGHPGNENGTPGATPREWLGPVEAMVEPLHLDDDEDTAAARLDMARYLTEWAGELRRRYEQSLIAWMQHHKRELVIGDVRFYPGVRAVWKCPDAAAAMRAVLDACGGDLDATAGYLKSDPFKHGSCRGLLDVEDFRRVFVISNLDELREGQPVRLQRDDMRFSRRPSQARNGGGHELP